MVHEQFGSVTFAEGHFRSYPKCHLRFLPTISNRSEIERRRCSHCDKLVKKHQSISILTFCHHLMSRHVTFTENFVLLAITQKSRVNTEILLLFHLFPVLFLFLFLFCFKDTKTHGKCTIFLR